MMQSLQEESVIVQQDDPSIVCPPVRLLVKCPDAPGITAAVSGFLYQYGANIISANQHSTDPRDGAFFLRVEFETDGPIERAAFSTAFQHLVAERFAMHWSLTDGRPKRLAVLVSRYDHCLVDLLWRCQSGALHATIPVVISNHPDLGDRAAMYGVPFHCLPVSEDTRESQESELHALMQSYDVDAVILARYMQILTPRLVALWPNLIINIHHSFLPAFAGASPYAAAFRRGVKIIGATAHYVTNDLDEGPIIEQDIIRVSHRDSINDLTRLGQDVERQVLARAVRLHLEDRVVVAGNTAMIL